VAIVNIDADDRATSARHRIAIVEPHPLAPWTSAPVAMRDVFAVSVVSTTPVRFDEVDAALGAAEE
jgi:hypothetical protein